VEFEEIIKSAIACHSEDTEWKIRTRVRLEEAVIYRKSLSLHLRVDLDIQHFTPEEDLKD